MSPDGSSLHPTPYTRHPSLRRALAALTIALGACAPRSADTDGVTTIRLWALGREGEVVQTMVREFERAHPDIRVRVQQIPWTAAHEKLLTAHVGDATPDIAQLGNTWVPEFVTLDALEPLDPWVARSKVVERGDYFPGIWQSNAIEGTTYGIPWYVDTRLIFYRTDLLKRAGYAAPPKTWEEWRAAMSAVQRRSGARYGIFLPTNEWAQPVLLGMQAGSPLLKDDGRYGAFQDRAFRRAFDFYVSLFRDGLAPVAGNNDVANVYQEFARGQFAMWITGPWNIGEMKRRLPAEMQGAWGTAPLPGPSGDSSGVSLAGGASLVIFRASPHKAAAWALIEFLSSPEKQMKFARVTGDLPARREAWRRAGLATDPYARAFWEQLDRVRPTPQVPEWELIATKVIDYSEQSIRGGVPTAVALARLDRDVNEVLEKRRWLLAHRQGQQGQQQPPPAGAPQRGDTTAAAAGATSGGGR